MKKDLVGAKKVMEFMKKCLSFLSPCCGKYLRRVHSSQPFLEVMVSYSASDSEKCLKGPLHQLVSLSILQPIFCGKVRELS